MPNSHLASRRQLHVKFHLRASCSGPLALRGWVLAQKPEGGHKPAGLFSNHERHHRSILRMLPPWHCTRNVAQKAQRMRVHESGAAAGAARHTPRTAGLTHCCSGFSSVLAMNTGPRYGRMWSLSVQTPWHAGGGFRRESSACGAQMLFSLSAGCVYGRNCLCVCVCVYRPRCTVTLSERCASSKGPSHSVGTLLGAADTAVGRCITVPDGPVRDTDLGGQSVHAGVCAFGWLGAALGDRTWLVPVVILRPGCPPGACQPGLSLSGGNGWYRFAGSPKVM